MHTSAIELVFRSCTCRLSDAMLMSAAATTAETRNILVQHSCWFPEHFSCVDPCRPSVV